MPEKIKSGLIIEKRTDLVLFGDYVVINASDSSASALKLILVQAAQTIDLINSSGNYGDIKSFTIIIKDYAKDNSETLASSILRAKKKKTVGWKAVFNKKKNEKE